MGIFNFKQQKQNNKVVSHSVFTGVDALGRPTYSNVSGKYGDSSQFGLLNAQNQYNWNAMQSQQDFNAAQVAQQNAFSEQMWQKNIDFQSNYNSESAVAERARAAGLNPYMYLTGGNGSSVSSSAASTPSPSSSGMASSGSANVSNYAQLQQAEAASTSSLSGMIGSIMSQVANVLDAFGLTNRSKSQIDYTKALIGTEPYKRANLQSVTSNNAYNLGFLRRSENLRYDGLRVSNKLMDAQSVNAEASANLSNAQAYRTELESLFMPREKSAIIANTLANTDLTKAQTDLAISNVLYTNAKTGEVEINKQALRQSIAESVARVINLAEQTTGLKLSNQEKAILVRYTERRQIAELSERLENTDFIKANRYLTEAKTISEKSPKSGADWLFRKSLTSPAAKIAYDAYMSGGLMKQMYDGYQESSNKSIQNILPLINLFK